MAQIDQFDLDQLLDADASGCGADSDDVLLIPVPRSGRSYLLYIDDTEGRHGCLDAAVD